MESQIEHPKFSDFADEPEMLDGSKLPIKEILGKEILVIGHKIVESKYSRDEQSACLTLQFELDNEKHILFTGSKILIDQIEKYKEHIPFRTVIKKIDKYYSFT